jgi:hypothetical protein
MYYLMTQRGAPPVVAQKYEFVHNVGNCCFSTGNSWRKSREDRPLTSFISRWMPNRGSTLTVPLDMIEHHFEFLNLGVVFFADRANDLFQPLINRRHEHLPPVFETPDHIIVTGIAHIWIALVGGLIHRISLQHRALSVKSVCSRCSPTPSSPWMNHRGFRARSWVNACNITMKASGSRCAPSRM